MNYRKLLLVSLTSLLLFQESQARSYLSYAAITCAVMSTMGTIATIMNRYYKQSERNRVFTLYNDNIPQIRTTRGLADILESDSPTYRICSPHPLLKPQISKLQTLHENIVHNIDAEIFYDAQEYRDEEQPHPHTSTHMRSLSTNGSV